MTWANRVDRLGLRPNALPIRLVAASDSIQTWKKAADYGCSGGNDEIEIQAALDSLNGAGGRVELAPGTYSLKNQVTIPSNAYLYGHPGNLIQLPTDHALDEAANRYTQNGDTISALFTNDTHGGAGNTNIVIEGLNIDFDAPTGSVKFDVDQGYAAIWLHNCTYSLVKDCYDLDVVYDVNTVLGRAYGVLYSVVTYSIIDSCRSVGAGYEGVGIRDDCANVIIKNCISTGSGNHGMQAASWAPTETGSPQDILFDKCYADNDIIFHGGTGKGLKNCSATNCHTLEFYVQGDLSGIKIANCTARRVNIKGQTTGTAAVSNVVVGNCVLERDSAELNVNQCVYFSTTNANATIRDVVFNGCTMIGGQVDMDIHAGTVKDIHFNGCNIERAAALGVDQAVDIHIDDSSGSLSDVSIQGGNIKRGQVAIRGTAAVTAAPQRITLKGVTIDMSDYSTKPIVTITAPGSGNILDVMLDGCTLIQTTANSANRAIALTASSTGTISRLSVTGNHFINCYDGVRCFSGAATVGLINRVRVTNNTFVLHASGYALYTNRNLKQVIFDQNIAATCLRGIGGIGSAGARADLIYARGNLIWATSAFQTSVLSGFTSSIVNVKF